MVAVEAVGSTVVAEGAASTVEAAAISAVAELDRVSVEAHVPVAQAAFVGVHLARLRVEGRELTAIALTVRGPMGCTVAGARVLQVHVTAQRRGTEPIQV